jgi:glycosyltransferase involved in cell wall biosynthesis
MDLDLLGLVDGTPCWSVAMTEERTSTPVVSIIMAVKDSALFLPETLASLEAQTFQDWELVAIDDGSTDGSMELIKARLGSRAVLGTTGGGKGPAVARNQAITIARGRYLAILDSDDLAAPQRLEVQVAWMEQNPRCLACAGWAKMFGAESSAIVGGLYCGLKASLIFANPVVHSTVLIRRDTLLKEANVYDEKLRYAHDYQLIAQLAFAGDVQIISEVLANYRQHPEQVTQTHANEQRNYAIEVQRGILRQFEIDPSESEAAVHYRIGRGMGVVSQSELELAFGWLHRIISANEKIQRVSSSELRVLTDKLLLSLCAASCLSPSLITKSYFKYCWRRRPFMHYAFLRILMKRVLIRVKKVYF